MSVAVNKTVATSVLSLQSVASNSVVISSAIAVTNSLAGWLTIHFGRRSNTALTGGVIIRIEGSAKSSGDGFWFPLAQFKTTLAAQTSQAVNGTCASGQNVVAMTSTTGMSADPDSANGHIVYIDNGTIGNSEFQRVKTVTSNTSITLEDNLTNAQTGATVYPGAEMFSTYLDLSAVTRLRVVVQADNTGVACAVEALLNTADSIG